MRTVLILLAILGLTIATKSRSKRAAYDLPDGAELLVGQIRTNFFCNSDGYYADVDNNCQIFHVCHTSAREGEPEEIQQWSFLCGNQTVFNQLTFTCAFPEEAVPCANSPDFFYLNSNLGDPKAPFLTDQDIQRGENLIVGRQGSPVVQPPRRGFQG